MANIGKIVQIVGAVLDIRFEDEKDLPNLLNALEIKLENGNKIVAEVAQHIGNDTVRCIAMSATDGLVRGMEAVDTGAPISVPVGKETLGRVFNVLGEAIDLKPMPEGVSLSPIHKEAPASRFNKYNCLCICIHSYKTPTYFSCPEATPVFFDS